MANVYLNLVVPSTDGVGAAVDVSSLGRLKTITLEGALGRAAISIEISNDGGTSYSTALQFNAVGKKNVAVAAQFMRVRVANAFDTVSANCDVGSNDDGAQAIVCDVPPGNGVGAVQDVSSLGSFNTFQVTGQFTGTVALQISQDNVTYSDCIMRSTAGFTNKEFVAQFVRVRRAAVNILDPGTPQVTLAAINDVTSGGGGGGPPTGPAGGDLSGTYPAPQVSAITETSGPDQLVIGSVADGQFLRRDGGNLVGDVVSSSPSGPAGGDLSGTYPDPEVSAITETSGPDQLVVGAIADGQYLRRTGGNVVGDVVLAQRQIASMRLSADQVSNVSLNNHVEFNLLGEVGPSFLTLSTGAGQANGIATVGAGIYRVAWACRFFCNEGAYVLQLHDGANAVIDIPGQVCQSYGDDNVATDATEMPTSENYISLAGVTDLELRIIVDQNADTVSSVYSWWTIERLS